MPDLNPQPLPPGTIKVSLPVEVLYNLEAFQKVQASVLGRTGCPTCTSGGHFIWQMYEEFAVNPALEVTPVVTGTVVEG